MMFVGRIVRRKRKSAFGLRILDIVKIRLFVPGATLAFTLREVKDKLYCLVGRNIAKERIVEFSHGI
jgi:hypothetical protein